MSRRDPSHEDDFDRRWSAAGAEAGEREVIARDVREARELRDARLGTSPLALQSRWRSVRADFGAQRARDRRRTFGLGAAAVLASAAALAIVFYSQSTGEDRARERVASIGKAAERRAPSGDIVEDMRKDRGPQVAVRGADVAGSEVGGSEVGGSDIRGSEVDGARVDAAGVRAAETSAGARRAGARSADPQSAEVRPRVRTHAASPTRRPIPEVPGGHIDLIDGGAMHLSPTGVFTLDSGTLKVELAPRPPGTPPVHFRAGDLALEVLATTFALHVEGGHGMVRVFDGAVVAKRDRETPIEIDAGAGVVPSARRWEPAELRAVERWGSAARTRAKAPIETPRASRAQSIEAASGGPRRIASSARSIAPKIEHAYETPPIIRQAAPAESGERAELRAYGAALKLLRGGQALEAARSFRNYLDRYPSGLLRQEAELSRLEALRAAEAWDELVREGERWLFTHPRDARTAEVRDLVRGISPR